MADNTRAFYLLPPQLAEFGGGVGSALWPEAAPGVIWGQGVPQGERAPFTILNKGSLYMSTNQTDDYSAVYMKVDEGGDDADWAELMIADMDMLLASGVGFNLDATATSGASGWTSTAFFSISNPADSGITGYYSALELELTNADVTSAAYAPLVLNIIENAQQSLSTSAWIHFRDYGTYEPRFLFWIGDVTVGTNDISNVVMSSGVDKTATHYIRFIAGSGPTTYYLMCTTTAPAGS